MTVEAPGTNSKPRRRTARALETRQVLIEKLMAEGLSKEEATEQAQIQMRDNNKGDWRRG